MLNYSYPLFRPPAEADNIIIQATYGCSYNNCSFCTMYKTKKYKIRELKDIYAEIDILASIHPDARKVFLADGDALSLDTQHILSILEYLKKSFTNLNRVSLYASAQNIMGKSKDDLNKLYESGLKLVYFGIESGNDLVLKKITKGVSSKEIISSLNKVSDAGIKISATVILGIGGRKYAKEHIEDTAYLINATKVNYLSTLQLGLQEDSKENFYKHFKDFQISDDYEVLDEQKRFLELLNPKNRIIFRSNHASNALHLSGTLPKDKNRLILELEYALSVGDNALVPNIFRGF